MVFANNIKISPYFSKLQLAKFGAILSRPRFIERTLPFFADLRCDMTMGSWVLDNSRLDLDFEGSDKNFDFSTFTESNEWQLVASSASRRVQRYHAHESDTEALNFTELIYSMTIRRCVGFYVYALIIPGVLLSLLMPLTFWIPTSGDGRITLGIVRWRSGYTTTI